MNLLVSCTGNQISRIKMTLNLCICGHTVWPWVFSLNHTSHLCNICMWVQSKSDSRAFFGLLRFPSLVEIDSCQHKDNIILWIIIQRIMLSLCWHESISTREGKRSKPKKALESDLDWTHIQILQRWEVWFREKTQGQTVWPHIQRFKVIFIREIWLPVQETRRFILYPGDSQNIWESWHVW